MHSRPHALFAFMYLWCSKSFVCDSCQFGLRVIYHVLHVQLQIPSAKYLLVFLCGVMRRPPSTVFAKWKAVQKLVIVSKYLSNFSDQRAMVFKWYSCLGLSYFRVINLPIFNPLETNDRLL